MAYSTSVQSLILILLILSVVVTNLEVVQGYQGRKVMQKRIDSRSILRELGYNLSKLKYNRRDSTGRISPGGPDPHHNFQPTALP
ncbi:hypothetical protein Pint_10454 [Pistacia integerrima]|uniref:Uncharacterized protein n=1 Tax=Pistacia integerrima TaxID=434235 RepID=A0ACC0XI05_9ROSI|nr:hypothetical protein Pint_10454 [Pistacia integerrima]